MHRIATYGPDGRRTRSFSLEAIERLEASSIVVVRRNRKGVVTRAHFRLPDGGDPLVATCHMGQRYSVEAGSGALRWWEFKSFLNREDRNWLLEHEQADIELYLQSIFRAVPLSCLASPQLEEEGPAPTPEPVAASARHAAKVVSIDAFAHRRARLAAERPIEFDSERRVAEVVPINRRRKSAQRTRLAA